MIMKYNRTVLRTMAQEVIRDVKLGDGVGYLQLVIAIRQRTHLDWKEIEENIRLIARCGHV